jgi:prophage DNA circulation protein
MITSNSRYVPSVWERGGVAYNIAIKGNNYSVQRTVAITAVEGDTFDKIASRVLSDSTQYWKVAELNPFIAFPDYISAGTIVVVPLP